MFDLEYFYLNFEKLYSKDDIVTTRKKIIYRKVYTFYRKNENYTITIEEKRVRNYLSIYFRENVLY